MNEKRTKYWFWQQRSAVWGRLKFESKANDSKAYTPNESLRGDEGERRSLLRAPKERFWCPLASNLASKSQEMFIELKSVKCLSSTGLSD